MKRAGLPLILISAALFAGAVKAEDIVVPPIASTATSETYPEVTCTGTDAGLNADILQIAGDTRDQLGSILRLGREWRFPVHIQLIMPDDPLADKIKSERSEVVANGKSMTIEASLPSSDPDAKTFIQRQFVTALLWEKFFAKTKSFDTQTKLDVVPVWLIEGLNECLFDEPGADRETIVKRAAINHRAPTLAEIVGWQDISHDRLLGLYQRAFCYYLVKSLVHAGSPRATLQEWISAVASGSRGGSATALFPTEEGWQQLLRDAPARSHEIVYTWDDSAVALSAAETIAIAAKDQKDIRICTLETVADSPHDKDLIAALQQKNFDLTSLELRAHPSWRPIIALYRYGLSALIDGHTAQAKKLIAQADERRKNEVAYHQKLIDYVNWFEVTNDYAGMSSEFESYFSAAQELEKAQANPAQPNPIRADLNRVESRL